MWEIGSPGFGCQSLVLVLDAVVPKQGEAPDLDTFPLGTLHVSVVVHKGAPRLASSDWQKTY